MAIADRSVMRGPEFLGLLALLGLLAWSLALVGCLARGQADLTDQAEASGRSIGTGPLVVDSTGAYDLWRALGWTRHEVRASDLAALPGAAPLTDVEREIARSHPGMRGQTVVFYDGDRLVAHGLDHPRGPGAGHIVLNRFGDLLWVVAPSEALRHGPALVASPSSLGKLLRARWDRVARMLGWGAKRAATRAPVYMGRIPAGERAAIVARIRAKVAAGRAAGGQAAAGGARAITSGSLLRPKGMSNAEFGRLIGWTRGGALQENLVRTRRLIDELPRRLHALRNAGITKQMAQQWADFYRAEAARVAGNPNALPRSQLMQAIADLL